ncbi:DNA-binding protein [Methylobacterium sp. WL8]|nr:DNA-binding protein [Methylobacterium sp. WL8]
MIALIEMMGGGTDGWGRSMGRKVFDRLRDHVDKRPEQRIFGISLAGIEHLDLSFASESLVEIAKRYRGTKGFYLTDMPDDDVRDNIDAAAARKDQPLFVWCNRVPTLIGAPPSPGNREALAFALDRPATRASDFASTRESMSIANSSSKFKQLWNGGFLLRSDGSADSGGAEFVYHPISDAPIAAYAR